MSLELTCSNGFAEEGEGSVRFDESISSPDGKTASLTRWVWVRPKYGQQSICFWLLPSKLTSSGAKKCFSEWMCNNSRSSKGEILVLGSPRKNLRLKVNWFLGGKKIRKKAKGENKMFFPAYDVAPLPGYPARVSLICPSVTSLTLIQSWVIYFYTLAYTFLKLSFEGHNGF